MTERQERFIDYYVKTGNASESARRAGYSAATANVTASKLLANVNISREIQKRLDELRDERTADIQETMQIVTEIMRGELNEKIVLPVGTGKFAKVETIELPPKIRDRLKAAELLAKIYGAFREQKDNETPEVIKIISASRKDNEL